MCRCADVFGVVRCLACRVGRGVRCGKVRNETRDVHTRPTPPHQTAIVALLPVWLALAAKLAPLTVLLDGLDQLRDQSSASLTWLPTCVPANCSLIISASSGSSLDAALVRRGWDGLGCTVPPLAQEEREGLVGSYLSLVNKTLEEYQVALRPSPIASVTHPTRPSSHPSLMASVPLSVP